MKITDISLQAKNKDRVNVSVEGKYRFSLDVFQVSELGLRVGNDYSEEELTALENESLFGKLYGRALEYTMLRPHSVKEVRDYLWRKTRPSRTKTGELKPGVPEQLAERVLARLLERNYLDDTRFAHYWVENRSLGKGASRRKLEMELRAKGVDKVIIATAFADTNRDEMDDLKKIIAKKRPRYPDEQKFMLYLVRQGFSYDDVKRELATDEG